MNKPSLREKVKTISEDFYSEEISSATDELLALFEETLKECLGEKEKETEPLVEGHSIYVEKQSSKYRNELRDEVLARFEKMKAS